MVNSFLSLLGVGSTPLIDAVSVALIGSLTICLAYKFIDFILNLVSSIVSRNKDIKF